MCLLAVAFRLHPDSPLIVAANRDEWLARPATATQLLRTGPRTLGGRDELAGGTWLAVNEYGVFAGLTNQPPQGGRSPGKRSRGELPLLLAQQTTAAAAVSEFAVSTRLADYSPCWLLAGDRERLFYLDMTAGERPTTRELSPGLHVLENRPLEAPSAKADWVRQALAPLSTWRGEALWANLGATLASHLVPPGAAASEAAAAFPRPLATEAACVHAGPYGTRSSAILMLSAQGALPGMRAANGPPCTTPFAEVSQLWSLPAPQSVPTTK